MTIVTVHYLRRGEFKDAMQFDFDDVTDRQKAVTAITSAARGTGYDTVQVWFGDLDGRLPDATAEVPR